MDPYLAQVIMFGGNFAPRGWALCQGQLMSIAQNTALFSLLGTTFGGDGQTTFGLPDFRGRLPVGTGQGPGLSNYDLGEVTGTESVTLTTQQMAQHNHGIVGNGAEGGNPLPNNGYLGKSPNDNLYATTQDGTAMGPQMCKFTGGGQPTEILQPLLAVNFIICTEGIYPSRN